MKQTDAITFLSSILMIFVFNFVLYFIVVYSIAFVMNELWLIKTTIIVSNLSIALVALGNIKRSAHNKSGEELVR